MRTASRLLVVEMVLPEGRLPPHAAFMDLNMMVMLAGKERTETEFRTLLGAADLRLERVIPMPVPHCIVEAVPA